MAFDLPGLADFAVAEISRFAAQPRKHEVSKSLVLGAPDETFYAFAIDGDLLCLNTLESFAQCLNAYQEWYPDRYHQPEIVEQLRMSTGDWAYQGFARMGRENGFDEELYAKHYDIGFQDAGSPALQDTEYAVAMDEVLELLKRRNAFVALRKTADFVVCRVEHEY